MIIEIKTDSRDYDVVIENGALERAGEYFRLDRGALIVTDSGVPARYAQAVAAQCGRPVTVTVPEGEVSKSFERFQELLNTMLDASFSREDCVVAVGGGVVGDLSGFAASCYMRGIDFYNIPTTLLAQVDSSVGGKTAIDLAGVKNIVGSFYQPKKVLVDPTVLETLNRRQLMAGLAEAIKMAATCDAELFRYIEDCRELEKSLPEIIARAISIKKAVVERDTRETGLRRVLNFGHTVGHAIESFYGGRLLHGECVALGMLPMCSAPVRERLERVLEKYSLPTKAAAEADALMPYVLHDKKIAEGQIITVLVESIGSFELCKMTPEQLRQRMEGL